MFTLSSCCFFCSNSLTFCASLLLFLEFDPPRLPPPLFPPIERRIVALPPLPSSITFFRKSDFLYKVAIFKKSDFLKKVDRKSTRLNSSHVRISYAVFCLKKKKKKI